MICNHKLLKKLNHVAFLWLVTYLCLSPSIAWSAAEARRAPDSLKVISHAACFIEVSLPDAATILGSAPSYTTDISSDEDVKLTLRAVSGNSEGTSSSRLLLGGLRGAGVCANVWSVANSLGSAVNGVRNLGSLSKIAQAVRNESANFGRSAVYAGSSLLSLGLDLDAARRAYNARFNKDVSVRLSDDELQEGVSARQILVLVTQDLKAVVIERPLPIVLPCFTCDIQSDSQRIVRCEFKDHNNDSCAVILSSLHGQRTLIAVSEADPVIVVSEIVDHEKSPMRAGVRFGASVMSLVSGAAVLTPGYGTVALLSLKAAGTIYDGYKARQAVNKARDGAANANVRLEGHSHLKIGDACKSFTLKLEPPLAEERS